MHYLGTKMDKILEIRCSDWDADTLSQEQINYAAFDAQASVLIYHQVNTQFLPQKNSTKYKTNKQKQITN